jgi:hypothetical protein
MGDKPVGHSLGRADGGPALGGRDFSTRTNNRSGF